MAPRRGTLVNNMQIVLMALPTIILGALLLYMVFWNLYFSFKNWSLLVPIQRTSFVGLATYASLLKSLFFTKAVEHSFIYSAALVAIGDLLGLLLAGLLYFLSNAQRSIYLSIFLYPLAISMATNGLIWDWFFNPLLGLDWLLARVGIPSVQWLNTETSTMISMFIVETWAYTGLAVLFYLAAFMGIEKEVVEAARIDGASGLKILFRILVPNSMNGFIVATALLFLFSFRMFSLPFVIGGGPTNLYLMTLAEYVYYGIYTEYFSQSAAASMIIVTIATAVIIPYALLGLKRWVMRS